MLSINEFLFSTNGTLSFYECKLSGGDTQTLLAVIEFI